MEAGAPPDGLTSREVLVRQSTSLSSRREGVSECGGGGSGRPPGRSFEPGLRQREQGSVMSRQRALDAEGTVPAWSSTGPVRQEHREQGLRQPPSDRKAGGAGQVCEDARISLTFPRQSGGGYGWF